MKSRQGAIPAPALSGPGEPRRSLALYAICVGVLMIVLDTTIVAVSLPSIADDLQLTGAARTWTLNAYMLTFGGLLVLGGRLGDVYGPRRIFLSGIVVFTLASFLCGMASDQSALILGRSLQGVGGAIVNAVSLSLITRLFSEPRERAWALGIYGFVCAAGGGIGEVLGGLLTKTLGWHWIFLVNLPIGLAVCLFCGTLLPRDMSRPGPKSLDIAGALTATLAMTVLVYALANGNDAGWISAQTPALFATASCLIFIFLTIERHAREPLMPLTLFGLRSFSTAIILAALWAAGEFAWFILSALYLQHVLGYQPMQVGLAFLPATAVTAIFSVKMSEKIVAKFAIRAPLTVGLLLLSAGLALFARAPLNGTFLADVLPGMLLLGLGSGIVSSPLLLTAMRDVGNKNSGVASGLFNTSMVIGGALGVALLSSLADARAAQLTHSGMQTLTALNSGYHLAFLAAAAMTSAAGLIGLIGLAPASSLHSTESSRASIPG